MTIAGKKFANTGQAIQVAGLKTSDSKYIAAAGNSAFDANGDRIVEIHNLSSADCFFIIKVQLVQIHLVLRMEVDLLQLRTAHGHLSCLRMELLKQHKTFLLLA
jgi:hypothetical protein